MSDTLPPSRASDTQRLPVEALRLIRRASMEGITIEGCTTCSTTGFCEGDSCFVCGGVGYYAPDPTEAA